MRRIRTCATRAAVLFLATVLLFACCLFSPGTPAARADVAANISRLSEWQRNFLRVISSLALKDAYDKRDENGNHVFASMTAGQALYEGGWARYGISVIANNQYGIKAYSTWKGKVMDNKTYMLYDSYETLAAIEGASYAKRASTWRAYDSWDESVDDHSNLFYNEKKYAKLLQATDYKDAARKVVEAGYCSDNGYDRNLIKVIEDYGLDALDLVTADEYGVIGMIMDRSRAVVGIGETLTLSASAYPDPVFPPDPADESRESTQDPDASGGDAEPSESSGNPETSDTSGTDVPSGDSEESGSSETSEPPEEPTPDTPVLDVVWESNAPEVATVDAEGNVTGVSQGIALVTATYNGKEAACMVCVGTNAFLYDANCALYSEPDPDSNSLGKVAFGMPVNILETVPYTDEDGTDYYRVTANLSNGKVLTGYLPVRRVYPMGREVTSMHMETVVHLNTGDTHEMVYQQYPVSAEDRRVWWKSNDRAVATVSEDGVITAAGPGSAVVIATAAGGVTVRVIVNVDMEAVTGVATTDLKLRENPDLDSDYYGIIAGGTHMSLLKGPADGWFYVRTELMNNNVLSGWCLAQYVETDGPLPVGMDEPDPGPDDPDPVTDPDARRRSGRVRVDTVLNVRDSAGTKGAVVAQLPDGTDVLILGEDVPAPEERTYKTWYRISFTYQGNETEGYAAANFVEVTGELPPADSGDPGTGTDDPGTGTEDPGPLQLTDYRTDDQYVWMVAEGTNVAQFRAKSSLDVTVFAIADGGEREKSGTETLVTGDVAAYRIGDVVVYRKEIAVMGDVDGDGSVKARDYALVKRDCLNTWTLEGVYCRAGCFSDRMSITASDYAKVKRMVLGTYAIQ